MLIHICEKILLYDKLIRTSIERIDDFSMFTGRIVCCREKSTRLEAIYSVKFLAVSDKVFIVYPAAVWTLLAVAPLASINQTFQLLLDA